MAVRAQEVPGRRHEEGSGLGNHGFTRFRRWGVPLGADAFTMQAENDIPRCLGDLCTRRRGGEVAEVWS